MPQAPHEPAVTRAKFENPLLSSERHVDLPRLHIAVERSGGKEAITHVHDGDVCRIGSHPSNDIVLPSSLTVRNVAQNQQQQAALTQWWLDRMIEAPKPLAEKMTFFWHGHFVSGMTKVKKRSFRPFIKQLNNGLVKSRARTKESKG